MISRRSLASSAVIALLVVAAIAYAAMTNTDTRREESLLVSDARALEVDPLTRPVHAGAPSEETVGAAMGGAATTLTAAMNPFSEKDQPVVREVTEGKRPFADLPPSAKAVVNQYDSVVTAMLHATHARSARAAPPMNLITDSDDRNEFKPIFAALRLAALRVRRAIDAHDYQRGIDDYLDGLALGRDLTWNYGLVGMMAGTAAQQPLLTPCREVIVSAPRSMQQSALASYRTVLDGIAPIEHMIKQEDVWSRLQLFGSILSRETLAALPAGLAARAAKVRCLAPAAYRPDSPPDETPACSWLDRRRLQSSWKEIDDILVGRGRALALPKRDQDELVTSLVHQAGASSNPYVRNFGASLERFTGWNDELRDRLNKLEIEYLRLASLAYHSESTHWPTRVEDLVASKWIARAPLDHFDHRPLTISPSGESAVISANALSQNKTIHLSRVAIDASPPRKNGSDN